MTLKISTPSKSSSAMDHNTDAIAPSATTEQQVSASDVPVVGQKSAADYYFSSYSHFGIHEEMLKDTVRTSSYRNAIRQNKHLFRGKVVLDVGCGTGILSMFAAQAGAKLVIGVDMSDMIHTARKIVKDNGFEKQIVLVQGKMEQVELPVDKVDIIISEWMGYFLLYESMLDTVLYARDRYLNESGLIFPDRTTIHIAALEDAEYKDGKINYWDNVYGFDFSAIKPWASREPLVDIVNASAIVSSSSTILDINLNTVTKSDLTFTAPFELIIRSNTFVHGFVCWFDTFFNAAHKPVYFSTGPHAEYTHWKQTIFYTKEDPAVCDKDILSGTVSVSPNSKNHRDLDIQLVWDLNRGGNVMVSETQSYHMC